MKLGYSLDYVSLLMNQYLKPGMTCIDATCGNGNDSLTIHNLIGSTGKLYAFDIQELAVENTSSLLKSHGYAPLVYNCNHAQLKDHVRESVDFIIYNLGYLPGGDKSVTTLADTTIESIKQGIDLLNPGGLLILVVYIGHGNGKIEGESIDSFTSTLDQKMVNVSKISFLNQKNTPPYVLVLNKNPKAKLKKFL